MDNSHSVSDYYEDLQVSPNADKETIERVYRLLAKRYHPDNQSTGNLEKFNIIMEAHRVLCDPQQRAAYDAEYDNLQQSWWKTLSTEPPFDSLEDTQRLRFGMLAVLYKQRKQYPTDPGIGIFQLEKILDSTETLMEFHIWYLKEKGWVQRTESGKLAITAEGCDIVEQNGIFKSNGNGRKLLPDLNGDSGLMN
jgi:hypothetical protein